MLKVFITIPLAFLKSLALFTKLVLRHFILAWIVLVLIFAFSGYKFYDLTTTSKAQISSIAGQLNSSQDKTKTLQQQYDKIKSDYDTLKNQDQVKRNDDLQGEIKNIHDTYQKTVSEYEKLQDFKAQTGKKWDNFDKSIATAMSQLSDKKYQDASKTLDDLDKNIQTEQAKLATPAPVAQLAPAAADAPTVTSAPDSGYHRVNVQAAGATYTVDIVGADSSSTKVIIDTASDSDCANNCPVMNLGDYASRSGAYAGINGNFFCPESYPSCAGKTNSFDTLVMNKNKTYFNSGNNIYSTVPAVIFSSGGPRFVGATQDWGRDTGVDGVIANYPMLVSGGNVVFGGSGDPKFGGKGNRSFVANKGAKVYIGYVHGASMSDSANVMKALGMDNALNMDEGGSSAMWVGGRYIVGPGRGIPNAILFVNR